MASIQQRDSVDNVNLRVPPEQLHQIPLSAISPTLQLMLKPLEDASTRIVRVDGIELLDNLQGLAELLLDRNCVADWGAAGSDSIGSVLDTWNRQDPRADCATLWRLLVLLGRFDLLRNCYSRFLFDAALYRRRRQHQQPPSPAPEPEPEKRFDAYVSFCEQSHEDSAKAAQILAALRDNGLEVVSTEDRLAGVFTIEDFPRILSRCNRVLVLWSRAYQADEDLRFELNHARSTDPSALRRRVIPVLLDDTPTPGHLAGIKSVRFGSRACTPVLVRSVRDANNQPG